jgi:hypothetical protein
MERHGTLIGFVFFVAAIAVHLLFGIHAFIRVLGVWCMFAGIYWSRKRSIPVGWEGREPSFHLRGPAALAGGVLMLAIGILLVFFAAAVNCFFSESTGCQ